MLFPMTQMSGDMGSGFRSMTTPMIGTVLASLILSLTLTPLMASRLLKPIPGAIESEEEARKINVEEKLGSYMKPTDLLGRTIDWLFLRHFFRFESKFGKIVEWSLKYPWVILAAAVASIWVTISIYDTLDQEQMPLTDTSIILGYVRVDPNVSPDRMFEIAEEISAIALEESNVVDMQMMVGKSPMWGQFFTGYEVNRTNEAMVVMNLTIAR